MLRFGDTKMWIIYFIIVLSFTQPAKGQDLQSDNDAKLAIERSMLNDRSESNSDKCARLPLCVDDTGRTRVACVRWCLSILSAIGELAPDDDNIDNNHPQSEEYPDDVWQKDCVMMKQRIAKRRCLLSPDCKRKWSLRKNFYYNKGALIANPSDVTDVSQQDGGDTDEIEGKSKKSSESSDALVYDAVTDRASKRGYTDFADFCMEYNCGNKQGDSNAYLHCIRENNCG